LIENDPQVIVQDDEELGNINALSFR